LCIANVYVKEHQYVYPNKIWVKGSYRQAGIHWNPCKGENKIVELPEQYIHSSAKFYITGEQGIYPVTSYTELEDIDLTK